MAISDPIADALTKIRNALMAEHESVELYASHIIVEILKILKVEGYIQTFRMLDTSKVHGKRVKVVLKYDGNRQPVIHGLERISKPSRRVYAGYQRMPRVYNNLGIMLISSSAGVVTGKYARKHRVGGELLCSVW